MKQEEVKAKILELLNVEVGPKSDGEQIKEGFAQGMSEVIVGSGAGGNAGTIELYLDDNKNVRHKERQLGEGEDVVLLAYRYIHKGTRGKGRVKRYKRNSTRWRVHYILEPSTNKLTYPCIKGTDSYIYAKQLKWNNYSSAVRHKTRGYKFVRYGIAIVRWTGPAKHEQEAFEIQEMRTFKVAGIKDTFISVNIE